MSNIPELQKVPEVSFIDNLSLSDVQSQLIADYVAAYKEITGDEIEVPLADPVRLILYATALLGYQCLQFIDRAGKMDLLKYSVGNYLDNIAALKGIIRKPAIGATTTIQFTLSALRSSATGIPGGTRVRDENKNYFATNEYTEIPAGSLSVDVTATALTPGKSENGCAIGTLTTLVDPIPYIASVSNTTESSGGDEIETDDDLTWRVFMAPAGYSVAGPKEAYEYWARQWRSDIKDVRVYTPSPTAVNVLFILSDGSIPGEELIASLQNFLRDGKIRPLTDEVTVAAPTELTYNLNLTYYINDSDKSRASVIQTQVNDAILEYEKWQRKIGRDINPSELIRRITDAGAKRVAVISPVYTVVGDYYVSKLGAKAITYGGLEDD